MKRLYFVAPLAFLLILLLLYSTFNSVGQTLLILLNVPFACVGGIVVLWLRQMDLTISAAIGFIALSGVAVLNGVVMISYINSLSRSPAVRNRKRLRAMIFKGATVRLRPVLMTALVASLGFIPMARSVLPGAEIQRPLASVVIGGLITSTILTLFVLPTLYEWIEEKPFLKRTKRHADREKV
jgi:cobalt-zinc-cadmium resistance protein CzcA